MTPADSDSQKPETSGKKPRLALAIATVFGVGYLPKAPGTFGSLVGVLVAIFTNPSSLLFLLAGILNLGGIGIDVPMINGHPAAWTVLVPPILALFLFGLAGVWSSSRAATFEGKEDPQYVVIDELSGMHLTLVLGILAFWPFGTDFPANSKAFLVLGPSFNLLTWRGLLLGFILFRVFDIWKPWPIRRLEKLPGGWGIMADDWMAGIYAAILLRVALHFNLV